MLSPRECLWGAASWTGRGKVGAGADKTVGWQNLVPTHGPRLSGVEGVQGGEAQPETLDPYRGGAEASADPKSSGDTGCPIVVPPLAWWGLRLRDNRPSQDGRERVAR